jgi:hypothetical protein
MESRLSFSLYFEPEGANGVRVLIGRLVKRSGRLMAVNRDMSLPASIGEKAPRGKMVLEVYRGSAHIVMTDIPPVTFE